MKYAVSRKGMIRRMHPLNYMQCVYNVQYDDMYDEMYDECTCMMNILIVTTALMENFDVESDFIASNYMYKCMHLQCICKSL